MEVVHARCAGLDVSKKDAKVCVRIAGAGRRKTSETVTTWGARASPGSVEMIGWVRALVWSGGLCLGVPGAARLMGQVPTWPCLPWLRGRRGSGVQDGPEGHRRQAMPRR
jgi:hypothetical protein